MTTDTRLFRGTGLLLVLYAVCAVLTGLALLYLGIQLVTVGGSPYYVIAAVATLLIAALIGFKSIWAVRLFGLLSLATLVWGLAETGWNGWAMIPRFDWLIVMGVLMAALWPVSRRIMANNGTSPSARAYLATSLLPALAMLVCIVVPILDNPQIKLAAAQTSIQPASESFSRANPSNPGPEVAAAHAKDSWTAYGGSNLSQKFSPSSQITPENVGTLVKAWEFHTGDNKPTGSKFAYTGENTPLVVDGTMYVCTATEQVFALNAATGEEKWHFDPKVSPAAFDTNSVAICRGVAYYKAPQPVMECQTRIVWGTEDSRLLAVDAQTGAPCTSFGDKGQVDLTVNMNTTVPGFAGVTSAPTIIDGVAIIGHKITDGQDYRAPAGVVRAIDVITGKLRWAWDIGRPVPNAPLQPGEHFTNATPNVWSPMAADADLNLVYVGTGNASGDFYGADRTERDNEYTDAVVALDARTGQERWHFRTVNHDLWDFDIGPAASLVDWPTPNGIRPALIQATKAGPIFVLDRETGKPLSPVTMYATSKERGVSDDQPASEQPISPEMPNTVGVPNVNKPEKLTEADAWGISPFDQLVCRIQFNKMRYDGLYTPPTVGIGSLGYPGNHGGMNWGGAAIDPDRGYMLINTERLPYQIYLIPRKEIPNAKSVVDEVGHKEKFMPQIGLPYGAQKKPWMGPLNMPCIAPPWGYVAGIDLRTKQVAWSQPMGSAMDSGPLGIKMGLPITIGTPSNGGPLATAGGLMFIGAGLDNYIRAFDTKTGKMVWQMRTDAGVNANPMSYEVNGRQFIAANVGGHGLMGTTLGDGFVAWALPNGEPTKTIQSSVIKSGKAVAPGAQSKSNMGGE